MLALIRSSDLLSRVAEWERADRSELRTLRVLVDTLRWELVFRVETGRVRVEDNKLVQLIDEKPREVRGGVGMATKNPKLLDLQFELTSGGTEVTLRDLFAAFCAAGSNTNSSLDYSHEQLARIAYRAADALAARQPAESEGGT